MDHTGLQERTSPHCPLRRPAAVVVTVDDQTLLVADADVSIAPEEIIPGAPVCAELELVGFVPIAVEFFQRGGCLAMGESVSMSRETAPRARPAAPGPDGPNSAPRGYARSVAQVTAAELRVI